MLTLLINSATQFLLSFLLHYWNKQTDGAPNDLPGKMVAQELGNLNNYYRSLKITLLPRLKNQTVCNLGL